MSLPSFTSIFVFVFDSVVADWAPSPAAHIAARQNVARMSFMETSSSVHARVMPYRGSDPSGSDTLQPERAARDLAVVQAGRAIELRDDRRKPGPQPPLVGASAGRLERAAPAIPPARHEAGERLDNQNAIALARAFHQPREQRVT